jgi:hypothetical protein
MALIREEEARYRVVQLVKTHPSLSNLLLKLQNEGMSWDALLEALQQAHTERPGDQTDVP